MPMALVMVAIFTALVLDPALAKQVESTLKGINSSLVSGAIGPVFNYWILGAFVAAGLGITVWLTETKIAKKQGFEVAPPPVASIPVPQAPNFGSSAGLSAGPITTQSSIQTGGSMSGGAGTPGRRISKSSGKQSAFGK